MPFMKLTFVARTFENGLISGPMPFSIGQLESLQALSITNQDVGQGPRMTLPDSLCNLTRLERLKLVALFEGSIPNEIGRLTSLKHLILDGAHTLDGKVPESLWNLTELRTLRLENTKLTGFAPLPEAPNVGPFPELLHFSVAKSVSFFGMVDNVLINSRKLQTFDISSSIALFTAPLLSYWSDLRDLDLSLTASSNNVYFTDSFWVRHPNLTTFIVRNSPTSGFLGPSIGTLKRLTYVDISFTYFQGTIPPSIVHCPLEKLIITDSTIEHPIPANIGDLNATLTVLVIKNLLGDPQDIPESIGALTNLRSLHLGSNRLTGTFPSGLALAKQLAIVKIDNNAMRGDLPEIGAKTWIELDAHNNFFTGTLPPLLASRAANLDLSFNNMSGTIPSDILKGNAVLNELRLSHNRFQGSLPEIHKRIDIIDLGYNQFEGEIPASYCQLADVTLSNNQLFGSLDHLFSSDCTITSLLIGNNRFSGTFSSAEKLATLTSLSIENNDFSGALPVLPYGILRLDMSGNHFSGDGMDLWRSSLAVQGLHYLDMSRNRFSCQISYRLLIGPSMTYLSVAYNSFVKDSGSGRIPNKHESLLGLDLTGILQSGVFPIDAFPNLVVLRIAHNYYSGSLFSPRLPLTQVDISHNRYTFEISELFGLPLLTTIDASNNFIHGSLVLSELPNLQAANFGNNLLDIEPDFASLRTQYRISPTMQLNISNNPIPTITDLNSTGLIRGTESAPSKNFSSTVICYELHYPDVGSKLLVYDEWLFGYQQCDCRPGHFGSPANGFCIACPSEGVFSCGAREALVMSSSFAVMLGKDKGNSNVSQLALETESCLVTTIQTLSGKSNCKGIRISADHLIRPNMSVEKILETQCDQGSDGRLCSRCQCNATGEGECWFLRGATCSKCRHVFSLSTSIPITLSILMIAVVIMTVIMAIVLRHKRKQSLKPFNKMPLFKRIFYRVLHLTTLGNVSILITFLQLLLAFTEWDAHFLNSVLGTLNGVNEGLGLRCFFPFLSDPLWMLLLQLSVPFIVLIMIATSVGLGSLIVGRLEARDRKHREVHFTEDESEVTAEDTTPMINDTNEYVKVAYPTMALLTSLSITVIKFFYFGTALAAHEYLFSTPSISGLRYIKSKPWLLHSKAWNLVMVSLPALLIFDLCIPIAFVVISWQFRRTFKQTSVQIYFGSLFETYRQRCFWWEIINTLRKLSIALIMKAFAANDALQSVLVVTVLAITQLSQLLLSPWRRKSENLADGASSLLLIAALIYTRTTFLENTRGVLWYIFLLSVGFVLMSAAAILWNTFTDTTDYEKRLKRLELSLSSENDTPHDLHRKDEESTEAAWIALN